MNLAKLKEAGIVSIRDELIRQQSEGKKIARTESGDPSFDIPQKVKEAMYKAIKENRTHYTPGAGIYELRCTIAGKLWLSNGIQNVESDSIYVTSGAMNALYVAYRAICNQSAGLVSGAPTFLVPTPTWTETVTNVILAGGQVSYYDVNPFSKNVIDIDQIRRRIEKDKRIVAIVINSPHNPTGAVLSESNLEDIIDLCCKKNLYLVSDEAYEHIVYSPNKHISPGALSDYDKIISIFSCSKSYAMSGLRLGYLECRHPQLRKDIAKYIRCTVNGVNSVTQHGAIEALKLEPHSEYIQSSLKEYLRRRNALYIGTQQCSFLEPVLPGGAFYIWARIKNYDWYEKAYGGPFRPDEEGGGGDWAATCFLLENGVGSAPGACFGPGGKDCIRLSFSCALEHVEMAAEILSSL